MKTVTFVYPIVPNHPIGGLKVVLDYANYLAANGIQVYIVYAAYFKQTDCCSGKFIKSILKFLYSFYRRFVRCSWFRVDSRVKEKYVWELGPMNIPQADAYIATSANSAIYIDQLNVPKEKKFYFIQHFETFILPANEVLKTYRYGLRKIVIAQWLKKIVEEQGQSCVVVPNGFHFDEFKITLPIEKKNKQLISMLYHESAAKDFATGLEAVKIVKSRNPELTVLLFGVYKKPSTLPSWIKYYHNPDHKEHLNINNSAAIYVGSSKTEGWGLTVGEAMMCGQAVVCTANDGYMEMAVDGRNALLSPTGNPQMLADNICKLQSDDSLRIQLANQGVKDIAQFDLNKSYKKFYDALELHCES